MEQEKALRKRGNDSGSSKVDVDPPKVESGKAPSSNGQ